MHKGQRWSKYAARGRREIEVWVFKRRKISFTGGGSSVVSRFTQCHAMWWRPRDLVFLVHIYFSTIVNYHHRQNTHFCDLRVLTVFFSLIDNSTPDGFWWTTFQDNISTTSRRKCKTKWENIFSDYCRWRWVKISEARRRFLVQTLLEVEENVGPWLVGWVRKEKSNYFHFLLLWNVQR